MLEVLEFMADATAIPILVDGDTGYGNFNTMRRLVRKLEQRRIAGVCIEDKIFPKTNSFIRGKSQPLANPEEFAGIVRVAKHGSAMILSSSRVGSINRGLGPSRSASPCGALS